MESEIKRKRVLLIDPPTGLYIREDRCQAPPKNIGISTMRPSIESAYIAAVLEEIGCICSMKDYPTEGKKWEDFRNDLVSFKPDMLIINTTTPTIHKDMFACSLAKDLNQNILTVAKGAHFLVYDKVILGQYPQLDVVIRGEAEITAKDLAFGKNPEDIDGISFKTSKGIIRNKDRDFVEVLDTLPFPARNLLNNRLYARLDTGRPQTTIQASRGCPGQCIFCLANKLSGKRVRFRSPANICDEIEECIKKYDIKDFFLRADGFTYNKEWVISVCAEIIKRKLDIKWVCNSRADAIDTERLKTMKEAGCYALAIGIESGDQAILDKIRKGITLDQVRQAIKICKNINIFTYGYFVIGFPWDTEKTIKNSLNFSTELDLDAVDFHIAYPFPGTDLFEITQTHGLFNPEYLYSVKPYAEAAVSTFLLTKDELQKWRNTMFRCFYLRPGYIIRMIKKFHSSGSLMNCLKLGTRLFTKIIVNR